MKTRWMLAVVLLATTASAVSTVKLGTASGTTSQTVVTGTNEWVNVQCGRTGATKVAYKVGNAANPPTATTSDEWLDFTSSLEAYRLHMVVPLYDRIAFIAADGTSSFTCEVWASKP